MNISALLHPFHALRTLRRARVEQDEAAARIDAAVEANATTCTAVRKSCEERRARESSGEWSGPWMIAKPMPPRGTRGGGLPDREP